MFRRSVFLLNGASGEGGAGGGASPAPAAAPPVAAIAPPAPAAAASAVPVAGDGAVDPAWLNQRLERERKQERTKLLKEIGATDADAAKAAVTAAQSAADAKKSAEERALEAGNALAAERTRSAEASAIVAQQVADQMAALTSDQQAAIRALAPDTDPIAQLKQLRVAAAFRVTPPAGATPAVPAATPAAPAPGATTAPAPAAPPSAAGSPPDHKAEYQRLKASNPVKAAAYMNEHANKIYPPA